MSNAEFYGALKLIVGTKNSVALININEFNRLERVHGEYKWIPFEIGSLPAIPVITSNFDEAFVGNDEQFRLRITPIWRFLSNEAKIITPNVESFEFTEYIKPAKRYSLTRKATKNPKYLKARNWEEFYNQPFAQEENAIQWNKKPRSPLLTSTDKDFLAIFLNIYKDELKEFNTLYENSVVRTKELKNLQRKSPKF